MAITTTTSARHLAAITLGLAAVSVSVFGIAGTANAATSPTPTAQSCSLTLDTGEVTCVPVGEDLNAAVLEEQGLTVRTPSKTATAPKTATLSKSSAGAPLTTQSIYIQSQLFDNASYGGSLFQVTSSSACNGSTVYTLNNLGSYGWSGRVSSFKSFSGCTTKLWQNSTPGGSSYGYSTNASSLGSMNDKANSVQVK